MPRGKNRKRAVVLFSQGGTDADGNEMKGGHIIGHSYFRFKNGAEKGKVFRLKYDPKLRKRVEIKVKDEKHSSGS